MEKLLAILICFTVSVQLIYCDSTSCPPKITKQGPSRPTLPLVYGAIYEYTEKGFTSIVEENYDSKKSRYSITQILAGMSETVYETNDPRQEFFEVSKNGSCHEKTAIEFKKSASLFHTLRETTDLIADKSVYLKFLVDFPGKYLIGYNGRKTLDDLHIQVDDWLFCVEGIIIHHYWTVSDDKTQSDEQFPIKISFTYPASNHTDSVYVFEYHPNEVNETALHIPTNVHCRGKNSNKMIYLSDYISKEMKFTTEVVDYDYNRILSVQNEYALDEKLVAMVTPSTAPKHPLSVIFEEEYIIDIDKHKYYKINPLLRTCETHDLVEYAGFLGDLFGLYMDLLKPTSEKTPYYFSHNDYIRGLRTAVYKGFKQGFPAGIPNVDSIVNIYMLTDESDKPSNPVALEFYTVSSNDPGLKVTGRYYYNLFHWQKSESYGFDLGSRYASEMYYCTSLSDITKRLKMTWEVSYPKDDDFNENELHKQVRIKFASLTGESKLRFSGIYIPKRSPGKLNMSFDIYGKFDKVDDSKLSSEVQAALTRSINIKSVVLKFKTYKQKDVTFTAVPYSLTSSH